MRAFRPVLPLLCGVFLSAPAGGAGQQPLPSPLAGTPTALPSPAPSGAAQPNLVADRNGRIWLSWLEPREGGGHRFRIASLTGSTWSAPITVAEGTNFLANWADFPAVFVAADGTMAAHWLERGQSRAAYGIRLRTSKDGGRTWSAPITPHRDDSPTEHGFVSFFDAPGGGVGLVWLDGREMAAGPGGHGSGSMTLRATTLRNGALGEDVAIDSRVCDCCQTSAARTAGGVIVAYRDRSDTEIRDTSVVRFSGGSWSAPSPVHADNWQINACPVNGPVVAAKGDAVAVSWFTGAGGAPASKIAFSTDGGVRFTAPVRLGTDATLGRLHMVMPGPDRVLVTTLEKRDGGAGIFLRDVRRDGRTSDPVEVAPATIDRSGGFARMALAGTRLVLAWTESKAGAPLQIRLASGEIR